MTQKNILLIGGSYGIGLEVAHLLKDNNNVIIASRSSDNIPDNVTHIKFDVESDDIST
ncbi:MAG: short-subunit dehydrogenase involved in D-alanine esterification of teichoic acids, partial [Patiriisocius sp.]